MASLFKKPGLAPSGPQAIKPPVAKLLNEKAGQTGQTGQTGTLMYIGYIIMYILLALIIIAIVMMLMGKKVDLSLFDFRTPYQKIMANSIVFWKPSLQYTNLITDDNAIPGFINESYTILFDCVLFNTRAYKNIWSEEEGPYRHILHRGSNELASTTVGGLLLGGCGPSGNIKDLPPYGLPNFLNPGVFLDPNLNDILIYVDTMNNARESVRVIDIPLDIPFRVAIVIDKLVMEVYINCKLEVTKILHSLPKNVANQWYGLAGASNAEAQIQNLHIWKYALSSTDLGKLCPGLPNFKTKRSICEGSDTPIPPITKKPGDDQIDLGFGQALKKCGQ